MEDNIVDNNYGDFEIVMNDSSDDELVEAVATAERQPACSDNTSSDKASRRFPLVSAQELEDIENQASSKGTKKQTKWGVGLFKQWLKENGNNENFEDFRVEDLAVHLRLFYGAARSCSGALYSKSTYVGIRASINRYLREAPHRKTFSIIEDAAFHQANNIFKAMLKKMKRDGCDQTRHHDPISDVDLLKLRSSSVLSTNTPKGLQMKVWFDITLSFARRGRENLRTLTPDSFVFNVDDSGHKFVEMAFNEATKNHQGDCLKDRDFEARPRMYSTGDALCPVASLEKYSSKRNKTNDIFFQVAKGNVSQEDEVWYTSRPIGEKSLEKFMKVLSTEAELSKVYTNHCVRATTITMLSHAGIEAREIMRISGHRNEQSIKSYNTDSSEAQKRQYSAILHNHGSAKVTESSSIRSLVGTPLVPLSHAVNVSNSQVVSSNSLVLSGVNDVENPNMYRYSKQFEIHNSNINVYNYYS